MAQAFEEIGSKWRLVVLHALLLHGEQRFSELQESTPADSATLSRVLGELEERDLVERRLEDRPIATDYDLTEKGQTLTNTFDDIEAWADEWTAAESQTVGGMSPRAEHPSPSPRRCPSSPHTVALRTATGRAVPSR